MKEGNEGRFNVLKNLFSEKHYKIKNIKSKRIHRDFTFNDISFFIFSVFLGIAVLSQIFLVDGTDKLTVLSLSVGAAVIAVLLALFPIWGLLVQMLILFWIGVWAKLGSHYYLYSAIVTVGFIFASSVELADHWDKVVIQRLGKFRSVKGPGLFFLLPVADRIADYVDTRIRVTDFSAEKTLTKDTVPVYVDALAFWMIWDPKNAVLEIEDYMEAVTLSAQTALRDSIGRNELATLLSERDALGLEIKKILENKTSHWGITILSVEFTEIVIPSELEDAMSKQAQAERERQSRIILSTAETEVARKFKEASDIYAQNPQAMQLRAMNMVYDGMKNNNSIMLVPSSALDQMNLGTIAASTALNELKKEQK